MNAHAAGIRFPRARLGLSHYLPLLVFSFLFPTSVTAQTGSVTGMVLDASTGGPLSAAQLSLEGVSGEETGMGSLSRPTGRFLILNVPPGEYVLKAQLLGFGTGTRVIQVEAGQVVMSDFRLDPEAIALSEIVVTGVVGATQRTKLPFEVTQVRAADLPVSSVNPAQSLQGKVAGAQVVQGNGLPGSTPSVLLRGVTALNASGRTQDPLYIVDGVILSSDLVDIGTLDIQSIEVVKGAAAASLYGSRAGSGIVHIRTRRGGEIPDDQIRYTVRSELGFNGLMRDPGGLIAEYHPYKVVGGNFEDANGNQCQWLDCEGLVLAGQTAGDGPATQWNSFQSNPWPGKTYDQVERFLTDGGFSQNHVSVEGRSGNTNFLISGNRFAQGGIFPYLGAYRRTNARINLDQHISPRLSVHASTFFASSTQPELPRSEPSSILELLYRASPSADLLAEDPFRPDEPAFQIGPDESDINPLYLLKNNRSVQRRDRLVGAATIRYEIAEWLSVDGNLSYDRWDMDRDHTIPTGYRSELSGSAHEEGSLTKYSDERDAVNGSITATGRWEVTDRLRNTTQIRYLFENWNRRWHEVGGTGLAVAGVRTLENLDPESLKAWSGAEKIRAEGYFLINNFDFLDRYILDALVRNDGSSLFGEEERHQWYYRVGGAWRLSQEGFFRVPGVEELKLRYSLGTAGGRPAFEAQYETFTVSGGQVFPMRLGNKELRPEHSTEHEMGFDLSVLNHRAFLSLTHARTTTRDQILPAPQPTYLGWLSQWKNVGTVESRTWEAVLDLRLLDRPGLKWNAKLLFDATRSEITAMSIPEFRFGIASGGGGPFFARAGEKIGTVYGSQVATSCAHLPSSLLSEMGCDQFAVNDEGYLVWIGEGGSFEQPQWGEKGPEIAGNRVMWGTPFKGFCMDRESGEETTYCPIGNTLPDYNLSLSTTLTWKGFSVYGLVTRTAGFDIYNNSLIWSTKGLRDQGGIPLDQQKPYGYYNFHRELGQLQPTSTFLEDGTFTKLREVSVTYQVGSGVMERIPGFRSLDAVRIHLTGQNLFLWTDYRGLDPDVGFSGGEAGSAAINRVDVYNYPNFRTFTGAIELVF